ncbi:uncharacterized protein EI90DRAFT_3062763, partial [Cantharellus anzutake]|uniref:uncharacterized protein n=1 Tax=Cantharellus anzutake TaxID=1750568 RepID=UPI001902EAD2
MQAIIQLTRRMDRHRTAMRPCRTIIIIHRNHSNSLRIHSYPSRTTPRALATPKPTHRPTTDKTDK